VFVLGTSGSAAAQTAPRIFYPAAAQEQGVGGRVVLECPVGEDGRLACVVIEETPEGMAFGAAALRMSEDWHVSSRTRDGQPTTGGRIRRLWFSSQGRPHVSLRTLRRSPAFVGKSSPTPGILRVSIRERRVDAASAVAQR